MQLFLNKSVLFLLLFVVVGCSNKQEQISKNQLVDYSGQREKVVERVKEGQLKPDQTGIIVLPADLKDASIDGLAHFGEEAGSGRLLAFSLTLGNEGKMKYLVYVEKDFPNGAGPRKVGFLQFSVSQKIKDHWYEATRSR